MALRMLFLAALVGLAGCSGKNPGKYEALGADTNKTAVSAAQEAADALWAQRLDPEKLKQAIAAYEKLAEAEPGNRHAYVRATRGWYFLADGFTEDTDQAIERYLKAIEWGKRCMALNTTFAERVNAGEKEKDAVDALTKDDVPCTYWTASALGKWAKASGIAKSIRHIGTVKAYISTVETLQPDFFHHGPSRYWGAYYSVIPGFAGRDLELSAKYFEETLAGSPNYLGSRVLRAENLAVANQDLATFDADLAAVLAFDVASMPELVPENSREQAKAKKLVAERDKLFDKKVLEDAAGQ